MEIYFTRREQMKGFTLYSLLVMSLLLVDCGRGDDADGGKPSVIDKTIGLVTGEPVYRKLNPYNNHWQGNLTLKNGAILPFALDMLITQLEEKSSHEYELRKHAFGVFFTDDETAKLAVSGSVSHTNYLNYTEDHFSSEKDREFVSLALVCSFRSPGFGIDISDEQQEKQATYQALCQQFSQVVANNSKLSAIAAQVTLIAERKSDLLEGIVVAFVPKSDGNGYEKQKVGSFFLKLSSERADVVSTTPTGIITPDFTFRVEEKVSGTTVFHVELN